MANRRTFLTASGMVAAHALTTRRLAALAGGAQSAANTEPLVPASTLASDPRRPLFHLLPARNWMNDPNGPVYVDGQYHMFFQYNPEAAVWGNMSWNHAVSPDMMHWTHLPMAMRPTPGSADAYGCFSGSALRVGRRVYQVYTGTRLSSKELATIRDGEDRIQESQCLAYSDDPQLIRWTKVSEPVIPLPPPGMPVTGFRDPSAWREDDWYYMTVGSGIAKVGGCVLLYRSKDLKAWEYLHPLTSGTWTGQHTSNPCDDAEMWECPDFFPLDGRHVLIYSTMGKVVWQSGELDTATMKFHPMQTGELDLGAFYAPKTQLDAKGRRILWGWIQERRSEEQMRTAGWSGMMSLPRVLNLDGDGRLRVTTLAELKTLREKPFPAEKTGKLLSFGLPGSAGEVLYQPTSRDGFVLTIGDGSRDLLHARYTPAEHAVSIGDKVAALAPGDLPTLHAFIDGSVIELIVGARIGHTSRFYYDGAQAPNLRVTVEHESTDQAPATAQLMGWTIRPISKNRLTTAANPL